jgi:hypothetical protein
MSRQQVCERLISIVRARIAEVLHHQPDDLPDLPLGRCINLLFLVRGEAASLGEYGATMASSYAVVGDLLWKLPSEFTEPERVEVIQ